jgi:hypothetical protein
MLLATACGGASMHDKAAASWTCRHRVGCHTYCLAGIGVKRKGRDEQEEYECLACLDYSRCESHCDGQPAMVQQSTYIMSFQRVLLCFLASCLCLHWGQAKVAGAAYPAVASLPSCGYQSVMAHIHDPDLNLQSNPKPSHVQAM